MTLLNIYLSVLLNMYKAWSLMLREKLGLKVFENVLMRQFETK